MSGRRKDYGIRIRALPALALAVTLAACNDNAPELTGPTRSSAGATSQLAPSTVQSNDPLSSRLSSTPGACIVAVRSPDGKYQSKTVAVALSKKIAASSAATIRFGYRGWSANVPEPTLMAVCNIPDSRSARTYFENQFGGKPMNPAELQSFAKFAGVSGVDYWAVAGGPQVTQRAGTTYVTDGLAAESPATKSAPTDGVSAMLESECDPTAIIPDPECGGGYTPEEEYGEPPPPDGVVYDPSMTTAYDPTKTTNPFPPPTYPPIVSCSIQTDNPHRSTHAPGYLNVTAWTGRCTAPAFISASTHMVRSRWVILFYHQAVQISPEVPASRTGTYVETHSSTVCLWAVGYYKGISTHTLNAYGYTESKQTASEWIGIKCA